MLPSFPSSGSLRRVLAVGAVALVACGAVACGDSDDGGGDDSAAASSSDERQVTATLEGFYDDMGEYDAAGVCSWMSPTARRQIAAGAIGGRQAVDKGSCEASFDRFLDLAKKGGGLGKVLDAKVGKVEVDGDLARATVSFGAQSGQVPLRKVNGSWKMGVVVATPSSEPPAKRKK